MGGNSGWVTERCMRGGATRVIEYLGRLMTVPKVFRSTPSGKTPFKGGVRGSLRCILEVKRRVKFRMGGCSNCTKRVATKRKGEVVKVLYRASIIDTKRK